MTGITAIALATLATMQQPVSLRASGAEIERVATGFDFVEGPAADASGDIYFSDIPTERVYRWSVVGDSVILIRAESGGANGLAFDPAGNLLAAEGTTRQITRMTMNGDVTVIVADFEGGRFNRPNDVWVDARGGIYFTDPAYSRPNEERDLDHESVYYVAPGSGKAVRVTGHLDRPNGVTGSIEGDVLYVTEHQGGRTWAYDIESDGSLVRQRLFVGMGADGMTVDRQGNVYLTNLETNSIDIYSPDGVLRESIVVPERASNVTFGGLDRRTLFITATSSLYSLKMRVQG